MSVIQRTTTIAQKSIKDLKTVFLVDIRTPESWIGSDLDEKDRMIFETWKGLMLQYYQLDGINQGLLVDINDLIINRVCSLYHSHIILTEIFKYLRVKLLSHQSNIIEHTVILIDFLVKNSLDYRIHLFVGQRKLMKTISVIGRRQLTKSGLIHQQTALIIFDCIQAWGEAFYPRKHIYPHIWETYAKLRFKYGVIFPRPYFDPTRVPIFLGPLRQRDYMNIIRYGQVIGSTTVATTVATIAPDHSHPYPDTSNDTSYDFEMEEPNLSQVDQKEMLQTSNIHQNKINVHDSDDDESEDLLMCEPMKDDKNVKEIDLLTFEDHPTEYKQEMAYGNVSGLSSTSSSFSSSFHDSPNRPPPPLPLSFHQVSAIQHPYFSKPTSPSQSMVLFSTPASLPLSLSGDSSARDQSESYSGNQRGHNNSYNTLDHVLQDSVSNMMYSLTLNPSPKKERKLIPTSLNEEIKDDNIEGVNNIHGLSTKPTEKIEHDSNSQQHQQNNQQNNHHPKTKEPKKPVTFRPPSSDADVEVRYFGTQRVATRKHT